METWVGPPKHNYDNFRRKAGSALFTMESAHAHVLQPPQADGFESEDHVFTLQSCHGAVVALLSEVLQEGSPLFPCFL